MAADLGQEKEEETQGISKKRVRNENRWKRHIAKKKRNFGEEYINRCNKTVAAKIFEPIDNCCKFKCWEKISHQRQENVFKSFYDIETFDLKSAYLFSLIDVLDKSRTYTKSQRPPKREKTRAYYLQNETGLKIKVCKDFFKKVHKVSDGRISRVLENKKQGLPAPVDKRGKQPAINKTPQIRIEGVINFISKFPTYESHYSRNKNPNRRYLAPHLSLGKMYELYKEGNKNPVSKYVFSDVFGKKFNLHFHAPVSDSCRKCDYFANKLKSLSNTNEISQIETERNLHQAKAESAREGMRRDAELAKNDPEEITVIAFDLMKTLPTPVLSTGICYYKRQLWTYCLGIHNLGTNKAVMYTWNESIASRGPQEIGSCVMRHINEFVKTKKLIMYSDQCGGQNRNIKMSVLCNYIVSSSENPIEEIDHKFLVSGHSYLPCDQDFGLIEKQKKFFRDIFIPQDWNKVIESARKRSPFKLIEMTFHDFFSTSELEKLITNRKISSNKSKVEWLKIQWLHYRKSHPFTIYYKYSNNPHVLYDTVNIAKRNSVNIDSGIQLNVLYPNGHKIDSKKKKDLLELISYIPPVFHDFYKKLKTSETQTEECFTDSDDSE